MGNLKYFFELVRYLFSFFKQYLFIIVLLNYFSLAGTGN